MSPFPGGETCPQEEQPCAEVADELIPPSERPKRARCDIAQEDLNKNQSDHKGDREDKRDVATFTESQIGFLYYLHTVHLLQKFKGECFSEKRYSCMFPAAGGGNASYHFYNEKGLVKNREFCESETRKLPVTLAL